MGQAVHIVDPFGIVTKESACFNPLEHLDPSSLTIREDLAVVADAIVVPNPKTTDPHWEDGARYLLEGMMAQIISMDKNPKLSRIRDFLALPEDPWLNLLQDMRDNQNAGAASRDVAARILRGIQTDEIQNIISNADSHSVWLSYPSMRAILDKSTFKFSDLKEKPTTIYLVIPPEYLNLHQRFLRMFINLALGEMPRGGPSKTPVLLIMDEFLQLGRMDKITEAFRLLAGYNFTIWPFIQDLGSMKEIYRESVNAFFANCRAVQVFSPGMDEATLKLASEMIGNRSLHFISGMESERFVALRDQKEVSQEVERETGMQYILRAGKPAMVLERVKYFEGSSSDAPKWIERRLYPFEGLYDVVK